MMLLLNILTVTLLALVAGLLLAVGQQVRLWRQAVGQSPLLAEQMATQLLAARQGLETLRQGVLAQGPELSRLLSEGSKVRTELQFLLEKAEQRASRLDMHLSKATALADNATVKPAKNQVRAALMEQVAGANGHAIQPSIPSHDPLEDLLAGLQEPTLNRRGPVTAAELKLQQRVKGA